MVTVAQITQILHLVVLSLIVSMSTMCLCHTKRGNPTEVYRAPNNIYDKYPSEFLTVLNLFVTHIAFIIKSFGSFKSYTTLVITCAKISIIPTVSHFAQ